MVLRQGSLQTDGRISSAMNKKAMGKYIAAYDIGTSGMKLVFIHPEQGVMGSVQGSYSLHVPFTGYAQQSPRDYWDTACAITKEALNQQLVKKEEIEGIIFASQWKGIIPVDAGGNPLHDAILWLDRRAGEQAEYLNGRFGKSEFGATDYWPKLLWIKQKRPEIYRETDKFLEINAWMKYCACGTLTSDLTSHFTKSPRKEQQLWYDRILECCEIPAEKFPDMTDSDAQIGSLCQRAAKELGLREGTPVFGGCGDIPAIAMGAGCTEEGSSHIYLGSSGWFGVTSSDNIWAECRTSGFTRTKQILFEGLEAVGLSTTWAVSNLFPQERIQKKDRIFEWLNQKMDGIGAGSEGLMAIPIFYGEQKPFPEHMRAAFLGVSGSHTRFHMYHAILEGICYLYEMRKESYEKASGNKISVIRAAGGGAKNPLWMQMMADVMGCEIYVCKDPQYVGSMGAAQFAMQGLHMPFQKEKQEGSWYFPDSERKSYYQEGYLAYLKQLKQFL